MKEMAGEHISIFDFSSYRDYLMKRGLPHGLYGHSKYNLTFLANELGYKSPSSLSMVLKGERLPSDEMVERLAQYFKMTSREKRYFKLLIEFDKKSRKNKDTKDILEQIQKSSTEKNSFAIDLKQFSSISEWYYIALKQLIDTPNFIEDEEWIHKRLRKKVTPSQIRTALTHLLELEIVKRDDKGQLQVVRPGLITTNDIPSGAIKRHHYGMLERASEAIFEQEVEERQINSTTLRIKNEDLTEAKRAIFDFLKEFAARFADDDAKEVYQFNIQLFMLTKMVGQQ